MKKVKNFEEIKHFIEEYNTDIPLPISESKIIFKEDILFSTDGNKENFLYLFAFERNLFIKIKDVKKSPFKILKIKAIIH